LDLSTRTIRNSWKRPTGAATIGFLDYGFSAAKPAESNTAPTVVIFTTEDALHQFRNAETVEESQGWRSHNL
jgi:hypothetical protein